MLHTIPKIYRGGHWHIIHFVSSHLTHTPYIPGCCQVPKFYKIMLNNNFHLCKNEVFPVISVNKDVRIISDSVTAGLQCELARRSNQSILKEISPGCSLEGLMLQLKLQCFGHLLRRSDSLEKPLMLGKIEGRRRRG